MRDKSKYTFWRWLLDTEGGFVFVCWAVILLVMLTVFTLVWRAR